MARVDGDGHADVVELAEYAALPVTEPRPLRTSQCGKLYVEKGKVALSPLLAPLIDQQRKQPAVFANSCGRFGVRFSLIPDRSADGVRN